MDEICRTCLKNNNKLIVIVEDIQHKIESISSIQMSAYDYLPRSVCTECLIKINAFYNYRNLIIKNDLELRDRYLKKYSNNYSGLQNCKIRICENNYIPFIYKTESIDTDISETSESGLLIQNLNVNITESKYAIEANRIECTYQNSNENIYNAHVEIKNEYALKSNEGEIFNVDVKNAEVSVPKFIDKCNITNQTKTINNVMKSKIKTYQCTSCNFSSILYNKYKSHRKVHNNRKLICNVCGKSIKADNFQKHLVIHTGAPVACKDCGKICKNTESLRSHARVHRGIEYKCKICDKIYKYRSGFADHLKTHSENNVKTAKCHLCDKSFHRKTDLKKHIRSHTGERPYPCEFCNKGFSSTHALKTHRRRHTLERPYGCSLCPMAFPQKVSLRTHMKSKHPSSNE